MKGDARNKKHNGIRSPEGETDAQSGTGRILVPVDFSPCSLAALEHAAAVADTFGYSIDVLHVRPAPPAVDPDGALVPSRERYETLARNTETQVGDAMRSVLEDLEKRGISGVRGRLECGKPSDTIVRIAGEEGYDLIVMGTHGNTGLVHLLHGSVAEKVVRRAPCPVLTIRMAAQPVAQVPSARRSGSGTR